MSNTFFVDQEHQDAFLHLVIFHNCAKDREYTAAFYILAADSELRKKGARFITDGGIDWNRIDRQDWSHGYKLLVSLAKHLFRSSGKIELVQGMGTWGDNLYNVAMQAIRIRKQGMEA